MAKQTISLDTHIQDVIARAVREALELFRRSVLEDINRTIGAAAAPAGKGKAASPKVAKAAAAPAAGKRTWPTCSKAGCNNKFFGPSGDARLCYQHYLEAGGKHPNQVKAPSRAAAKTAARPAAKAAKAAPAKGGKRGAAAKSSPAPVGGALLQQVVDLIAKQPGLRAEQISKTLGAKPDPVKAILATLRESGKVKVAGKARGTTYSL